MTQNHRPPRTDVVDVTVPVDICEIRTLGFLNENGLPPDGFEGTHWRIDATRSFFGSSAKK